MSSSKVRHNVPPPVGGGPDKTVYARYIPREEISSFAAWELGELTDAAAPPAAPPEPEPVDPAAIIGEQLKASREAGYHDGYRDGMAGLETFKQQFAQQATRQVGALVQSIGEQLDALQEEMADALGRTAMALARHVVRSELRIRPEAVAAVAREAIEALLLSARHVTVRVHPDDEAFVVEGAADVLARRGARVLADPAVHPGGCLVESDVGCIDASLESTWTRAIATIGGSQGWNDGDAAPANESPTGASAP